MYKSEINQGITKMLTSSYQPINYGREWDQSLELSPILGYSYIALTKRLCVFLWNNWTQCK